MVFTEIDDIIMTPTCAPVIYGYLPIYRKNSLKSYQLRGNYQQWRTGLIIGTKEYILPFCTEAVDAGTITHFYAYKLNDKKLTYANTRTKLTAIRTATVTLPTSQILQDNYGRYYCIGNQILTTYLPAGIYELYFTDGKNEFESEIFTVCSDIFGNVDDVPPGALSFHWDTDQITFDNNVIKYDKV